MTIDIIIPAYNEERSVAFVIGDIPENLVREIVVVDNNSKDNTAFISRQAGATVLHESRQGYGSACLCGIRYLAAKDTPPDVVVFLDADYSDHPEQLARVVGPILNGSAGLVIGSRAKGKKEAGAMLPQQVFGNWLATRLIRFFYGFSYSDLGPFRAITWQGLVKTGMTDTDFGWTAEMQIKAIKAGLKITEVPVDYRRRIGDSKIAGTLKGTILAGCKIIYTIFKYR